jgi:spore coat protein U-like protein
MIAIEIQIFYSVKAAWQYALMVHPVCYTVRGLQAIVCQTSLAVWAHCMIHTHTLDFALTMGPALEKVLQATINVVNYAETIPVINTLFTTFCEETDDEQASLNFSP